jgi:hypothetical protein
MSDDDEVNRRLAAAAPEPGIDPATDNALLRQRIAELEAALSALAESSAMIIGLSGWSNPIGTDSPLAQFVTNMRRARALVTANPSHDMRPVQ